jgi:hypothetical protein
MLSGFVARLGVLFTTFSTSKDAALIEGRVELAQTQARLS